MKQNVYNKVGRTIKSVDNVFGNFLVENGLYDTIEITKENIYELADLVGGHVRINAYCTKCGENRVFSCEQIVRYGVEDGVIKAYSLEDQIVNIQRIMEAPIPHFANEPEEPWQWNNVIITPDTRLMVFRFGCAFEPSHRLDYIVLTDGNTMMKIGQFPSVADMSIPELKKYRKVMTKEDERELKRAIGLNAQGIGIGSFVYLRRIVERMIMQAGDKAIKAGKINAEEFKNAKVDKKIKMAADYLPKSLVDNTVFYGIVSKGIHELSEDDCKEYFPVLQSFIIMVLRQWEMIREDEEEERSLSSALNRIASNF